MRRLVSLALTTWFLATPGLGQGGPRVEKPDLFAKSLEAAAQALESYGQLEDRKELRRVAEIGYRLAQESVFRNYPFSFYLVEMRAPNAFALPGGQVFITRGMLALELTDDELAGLLGHEIAHVTLEHGIKIQRRAALLNALSTAVLAGVIVASDGSSSRSADLPPDRYGRRRDTGSGRGDVIQGTAAAGLVVSELLLRSYSREFEDQADEEGQRLAAGAGFDPGGTAALMDKMAQRLPQDRQYGYWRTHPFFDDRVEAAAVRGKMMKVQEASPADAFRLATQGVILGQRGQVDEDLVDELESAALAAWPQGPAAEDILWRAYEAEREAEEERPELSRDYGRLLRHLERQREETGALTPESSFLARLDEEIGRLENDLAAWQPRAREILLEGIYETPFLVAYLSNYPDVDTASQAALSLGDAYARLGREGEAVEQYLAAWRSDPEGELGQRALRGLRVLAGRLDRLAALESLSRAGDADLEAKAAARLDTLVASFDSLENGAEYLQEYPLSPRAEVVGERMETLAQQLLGEINLYQAVGDHMKALDRIQSILIYAPSSNAAEILRDRTTVVES